MVENTKIIVWGSIDASKGEIGLTYLYVNPKNFKVTVFQLRSSFIFDSVCDVKTDSTTMAIAIESLYVVYSNIYFNVVHGGVEPGFCDCYKSWSFVLKNNSEFVDMAQ